MRILVGCPTYDKKAYCLAQYVDGLKKLTYPHLSFLLVDNSRADAYAKHIASLGVPVKRIPFVSDPRERVTQSRNVLREAVLAEGFDYFLSLEQDIVPESMIIEKMLMHKTEIVAAPYCVYHVVDGKQLLVPVVYVDNPHQPDALWYISKEELMKPQLKEVKAIGLGCVLIHQSVIEKISFRHAQGYDDMMFSKDALAAGYKIFVDTTLRVTHMLAHPN